MKILPILDDIKIQMELQQTKLFDAELLLWCNRAIAYLQNNKIPVSEITDVSEKDEWFQLGLTPIDYYLVTHYLLVFTMRFFDRTNMANSAVAGATQTFFDQELLDVLYHLKMKYDWTDNNF